MQGAASGIGGQVIAFSCLFPDLRGSGLFFIKQVVTTIVLPLTLALCVVLFWGIKWLCCQRKGSSKGPEKRVKIRDKMVGSLVVLFYLMFPSIMSSVTSLLQCTRYGPQGARTLQERGFAVDARTLLDAELSIECYEPEHMLMVLSVALPGLICFVVVVPLLLTLGMYRHAKKKELYSHQANFNPGVSYRFGFLFLGFEDSTYAWEILVMIRKAAFVVVAGFLRAYGAIAQVVGAVCILIVSLSLHLQFAPYEDDGHDRMEKFSLHSSLLILMIVLLSSTIHENDGSAVEAGGGEQGSLGPISTVLVIVVVFGATFTFFIVSNCLILSHSHRHPGVLGRIAKACTRPAKVTLSLHRKIAQGIGPRGVADLPLGPATKVVPMPVPMRLMKRNEEKSTKDEDEASRPARRPSRSQRLRGDRGRGQIRQVHL